MEVQSCQGNGDSAAPRWAPAPGSPSPWSQTDALPDLDGSGLERRWYPTLTALGDGTMLLTAGSFGIGIDTLRGQYIPAVYDPQQPAGQRWDRLGEPPYDEASPPFKVVHYYPFMHQISDGSVFMAGGPYFDETRDASIHLFTYTLNVGTETWCGCDSDVRWKAAAPGGSACMFSLDKIIKGGTSEVFGKPSLKSVEWMDMSPGATHDWLDLTDMRNARQFFYMIPLPDGRVLAIGGYNSTLPGPVRKPEWIVPAAGQLWNELADIDVNGTLAERREYHSASVLLPDGRVLISGGQYGGPVVFQKTAQIFRPPYLYNSSNQYLDDVGGRPVINFGTTPDTISYLKQFNINLETTDAGDVSKVCLIRLGAATHSVDQNTRRIELSFTDTSATRLRVSAPAGPAVAPPGYYMLFVLKPSNDGRENIHFPSKAKIVKVQMQSL